MNKKIFSIGIVTGIMLFILSSVIWLPKIPFDYRFENFYPEGKKLLDEYKEFTCRFGIENEFILEGIENPKGVFSSTFLINVDSLVNCIQKVKDVKEVWSPTRMKIWNHEGLIPVKIPMMHIRNDSLLQTEKEQWNRQFSVFKGLISSDLKSLLLFIRTEENLSKLRSDRLADTLRMLSERFFPKDVLHFSGRAVIQKSYLDELKKEFMFFLILSLVCVIVGVKWIYRKWIFALVILFHVLFILILVMFFLFVSGKKIDIMSIIFPPLAFILGASHGVHYLNDWLRQREKGTDENKIFEAVEKEIGFASLLAAATTCIGFVTFVGTPIGPLREFGLFASLLSALAYFVTFVFFPCYLRTFTAHFIAYRHNFRFSVPYNFYRYILKRKKIIYISFLIAVLIASLGLIRLKASHQLLEDLSDDLLVKRDLNFFENRFSGIRPMELLILPKQTDSLSWNSLLMNDALKIQALLRWIFNPGFLMSPAGAAEEWYGEKVSINSLSEMQNRVLEDWNIFKNLSGRIHSIKLYETDPLILRFSSKIRDIPSDSLMLRKKVFEWAFERMGLNNHYSFKWSGSAELIDENHSLLVRGAIQSFYWAFGIILVLCLMIFRSLRMFFIFIVPNIIPLILIMGLMALTGFSLKASSAMMLSIAIGIIVDDTFHFMGKYIQNRYRNYGREESLHQSVRTVGNSMWITSFILIFGFVTLTFSSFNSLFVYGLWMSVVVLLAILCDLLLLPLLIHEFDRK